MHFNVNIRNELNESKKNQGVYLQYYLYLTY